MHPPIPKAGLQDVHQSVSIASDCDQIILESLTALLQKLQQCFDLKMVLHTAQKFETTRSVVVCK